MIVRSQSYGKITMRSNMSAVSCCRYMNTACLLYGRGLLNCDLRFAVSDLPAPSFFPLVSAVLRWWVELVAQPKGLGYFHLCMAALIKHMAWIRNFF